MQNGKLIVARLWPEFSGEFPWVAPVIFGVNPEKYETICIYLAKSSSNPNIFEQKGKKVFYITQNSKPPALSLTAFLKLAKILRTEGVDILHCNRHISTFYGTIAAKLAKVPIILDHVYGVGRTRTFHRKLLNRFLLPHVDKILAVGQTVKNDILQNNPTVNPEKVLSIGESIDYDKFSKVAKDDTLRKDIFGIKKDAFVFATAGRLSQNKGQLYLIRAFANIKKKMPNAYLLIAGDGPLKGFLKKEATNSDCENSIRFLGKIDDMLTFYGVIDVFVLPSIGSEGLPRVLMEAMAAGILCIATKAGGIPELMDNGRCGFLVPSKNTNALIDAMLKAVNMPQQEKEPIISTAKERIRKNYNHDVMIKKTEKVYDVLVAEKIG